MAKNQIVLLVIVIVATVYLLSLLIKYEIKKKPKNTTKKVNKTEQLQEKYQSQSEKLGTGDTQPKELVVKKDEQEKQNKQKTLKSPDISVALLDELHEFQNYLKQRVTPENKTADDELHPYDTPRFSALDNSFSRRKSNFSYSNYDDFDDDFDDFPIREKHKESRQNNLENLPNEIKILMMTDFFDTKF